MNSKNKIVLITGASRGIGKATARKFAAENYRVICSTRGAAIPEFETIRADVSVEEDIIAMFAQLAKIAGKIDVLINNAAISSATAKVEELKFSELDMMFRANCYSAFLCSREATLLMKESGGSIINVSSEAAKFGGNNMAHYAASKAAINALTIAHAREVAKYNIKVNAVSPGIIDSGIHDNLTPQRLEAMKSTLPLARFGKPEEVAVVIFWLADCAPAYVTGSVISVAGGR